MGGIGRLKGAEHLTHGVGRGERAAKELVVARGLWVAALGYKGYSSAAMGREKMACPGDGEKMVEGGIIKIGG